MENTKYYNDVVESDYEVFGFYQDVFVDGKFVGCITSDYIPERPFGYAGRTISVAEDTFLTSQKKKVKKGQEMTTVYYPLCGRRLNK